MSLFALIPAAGSGSRMLAGGAKQFQLLAGKPMLWHALHALDIASIEMIFVVLAKDDRQFRAQDWSAFAKGRIEPLYCGGATRAESVHNGLIAAMAGIDPDDWVLVHDAARPCLPRADLDRLIAECTGDAIGGILALPIAETVKRVGKDEAGVARVAKSEDRSQLWLAQTPQMFRVGLLAQALRAAKGELTDEASAVEQLGLQPRLVSGSRRNIKVTYAEDLAIAEAILRGAAQ